VAAAADGVGRVDVMFHVKHSIKIAAAAIHVSRETFNEYAAFGQHSISVKHWTFTRSGNVSRETSVLDESQKTELNGSGSTQCR
jgi:hypothetical protein